ncbi:DegT/DnrJ/EryC1/StrS family aminotransferase [Neptuniibacter sp. QD29_5]|uniref:DegT/DnrJ/EryC1/StrS family aminotransferase n=1 Tax=Neptuniibacter sp. QD29_5 TaxID=3398207 RepID=UPI0039F639CA
MINILMPDLSGNERQYLNECIDEGWVSSQGRFVKKFEELVLRNVNNGYCLSTSNGTVALHLALVALGIGEGDEVIVPDITFGATLNAISYVGAVPVIVDIDLSDWNLSRELLDSAMTERTRAIMPVALFGSPAGIDEIVGWAADIGIVSIVDAAEAVGATIDDVDIGSFGDAVIYSYFGNKTITTGEGGAVIFRNEIIAEKAQVLRDHGMSPGRRYHHEVIGFNYRMTNIQAALGVAQYERLNEILSIRKNIALRYCKNLAKLHVITQYVNTNYSSSNWVFALRIPREKMGALCKDLELNEIEYRRCFEPMSLQPAFDKAIISSSLTNSETLFNSLILLPTHSKLSEADVDKISDIVIKSLSC